MAIPTKSLDDMIRDIKASLQAGERSQPAYTLLVGSGFSFPIIPTPGEMLSGDIAWWRFCKTREISEFRTKADGIADGSVAESDVVEFERDFWKGIHGWAAASPKTAFNLTTAGLPDLTDPRATGLAYHAVMANGLMSNKMRRQYLRDAIKRSYPRVNGAHIFLAGILEAQESWEWRAPFCRTIFTTNFDPLLQRSLQLVNKLYYMSDRPDVLEPPDDDQSDAIHLIYTHGSVHRYDLLNTEEQIEKARARNAPTLIDYFRRHGVIVIGYSGWADTTMEALASCPAFDSNLYWCDIHPAAEAESRLRPEVVKVLQAREKNAFYVPIAGADEAMRILHRELNLGPVPKFMLAPVATMLTQLQSIKVPSEPAVVASTELTPPSPTLAKLLEDTLTRLEVAKSAFDNPSIVRPQSEQGQEGVTRALVAQLFSDAYVAYSQGKHDHAIALWSTLIAITDLPVHDRATALLNRGVTWTQSGETARGLADYTTVVEMPDVPLEQKATALCNRGITRIDSGETARGMADYTTVIEMPDVPVVQKANALCNRGVALGQNGETAKEIADYTSVLEMSDVPAELRAKALYNRGVAFGRIGDTTNEIADYTAVIEMTDAPTDEKADALYNRAIALGRMGEAIKEIADYTLVIEMSDASAAQKADALINRALTWGERGEMAKTIGDYSAVIEMSDAPIEQKARALCGRGALLVTNGETAKGIADYTAVIEMAAAPVEEKLRAFVDRGWNLYVAQDDVHAMINDSMEALKLEEGDLPARSNLALGLFLTGQVEAARASYETLLSSKDAGAIQAAITDLEDALKKRPEIPEAAALLDRLRSSIAP